MITFSTLLAPLRAMRRHPWRTAIAVLILAPIAYGIYAASQPAVPEYVNAVSQRGDLIQTVEAVGTVTSDRDLRLQFPTSGIVAAVYVKEGDRVRRGQALAVLRNADLSANVASAAANVSYMQSQLDVLLEGNRPEDIAIVRAQLEQARAGTRPEEITAAEASLESKKASLQVAQTTALVAEANLQAAQTKLESLLRQANVSLAGQIISARSGMDQQLVIADNALSVTEGVLDDVQVQDAIYQTRPEEEQAIRTAKIRIEGEIDALRAKLPTVDEYQEALEYFQTARAAVTDAAANVNRAYQLLDGLPQTGGYSVADREEDKSTLSTQRAAVQTALSTLDTAYKSLQDSAASYDTQIAAEQSAIITATGNRDKAKSDIVTYEAAVTVEEAQLALKKAGPRPEDVAVAEAQLRSKEAGARNADVRGAEARVQQARAELARAQAQLDNTVLTAPSDGVVTAVDVKAGEASPAGSAVTLLGDSPYRIEMFVSEIDIPKVKLSQSGSVALDAFPGVNFALLVTEIDAGVTDKDGVPKYQVKLDFRYPHDELKIGMTGDAEIITGIRRDVVSVPRRSVLEGEAGRLYVRVQKEDGTLEERDVTIGMESGAGDVEVLTGLQAGETVVVLVKE